MFRELFDSAPDAMVAVDRFGRIVRANAQAVSLFGYRGEELTGAAIEVLVPKSVRAAHVGYRDGFIALPRVRPMGVGKELSAVKRNGDEFPVEIALSPINTPDGQMFIASIRDVSETHRARQATLRARYDGFAGQIGRLALAAPNLDAAFEHAPELVADALRVATVAILYRHAQQGTWRVHAAYGLPPDLAAVLAAAIAPARGGLESAATIDLTTGENDMNGSSIADPGLLGAEGFRAAAMVPLVDRDEPVGMLVALSRESDCFDHDALNFLRLIANQLGAATLRIRMEEQLSHAQRLEAVGQLTGGIAHDFNNLLTVISGNLEILQDGAIHGPQAHEVINNALRAVGRGAELTRKLLAFARRQRLSPAATDPQRLLRELGALLKRTLGETIELEIACADGLPAVYADPGQLEGALVNLALNARDAMPRGGRLSIGASGRQRGEAKVNGESVPGNYVVFAVRDTGLGMPPEVLARAFEPFFTTKESGKGTGLGLSMVYGFVKQSGGHISAESRLGYGTSIELYLPVADAAPAEEPGGPATMAPARGQQTILVVEDEADVREIATAFLRSGGYRVISESSAEAALILLDRDTSVTLVFSDVVLSSGMSGIDLAHEMRRRHLRVPILLTSGYEGSMSDNGRSEALEIDLVRKPYRRQELLAAVRKALDSA